MNLSTAIRLGSMLAPQRYLAGINKGSLDGTCALQAAADAVGVSREHFLPILDRFPVLKTPTTCPECGRAAWLSSVVGSCLNDTHRWTRERIADFVQTLEPPEVVARGVETEDEVELEEVPVALEVIA